MASDRLESLACQLCDGLPLATTFDALIADDGFSCCVTEGCDTVFVHDHFGRLAL